MEKYEDYWNELDELRTDSSSQNNNNDYLEEEFSSGHFREGDQEADWLRDVGLSNLTETFRSGREIADTELSASVSYLSSRQAAAVKRRVWTLNQTIRNGRGQGQGGGGQRARQRKPDIRDVFRDAENSSTGTRSRSATPDSLDDHTTDPTDPDEWPTHPNNNNESEPPDTKTLLDANATSTMLLPNAVAAMRKQDDEELLMLHQSQHYNAAARSDMFRKPGGVVGQKQRLQRMDVASDSEGIELVAYQRIGTLHPSAVAASRSSRARLPLPTTAPVTRTRTTTNPSLTHAQSALHLLDLATATKFPQPTESESDLMSFEQQFCGQPLFVADAAAAAGEYEVDEVVDVMVGKEVGCCSVEEISDVDYVHLRPLLWLEVSAGFDKCGVQFHKKKPIKRKQKENGNVFGVSLSTLVMRDRRISHDNNSTVPLIFQIVLRELATRGCYEEGILRIAGQKQRVEHLCAEIEADFYTKPNSVRTKMAAATCPELVAVLKRLLRDLPQTLLTGELIQLFYQTHALSTQRAQHKILNLLVLLLPVEHSSTLKTLLSFLLHVVKHESTNKMSLHNVAMIIAPSLFPPKYISAAPFSTNNFSTNSDLTAQVKMAAVCCRLVEMMLVKGMELWLIPGELWLQLKERGDKMGGVGGVGGVVQQQQRRGKLGDG